MIAANAEHRAFNLRSLLWRSGPWVSDGIWIAHHSLKLDRKERPRFFLCQTIAKSDGASS